MRTRKSVGGIVEGEDNVPFTKEDPADRVDPFTGEPYQEQMDRLGFKHGGQHYITQIEKQYNEKGEYTHDAIINKEPDKWVKNMYEELKKAGVKYPALKAVQSGFESRYGFSDIAQQTNNTFGVKVRPNEKFKGKEMPTKENYGEGFVKEIANFRAYDSMQDNIKGYENFLRTGKNNDGSLRYKKALEAKDEIEYLNELQNAGYATDPNYASNINKIYNRYKDAGIFD